MISVHKTTTTTGVRCNATSTAEDGIDARFHVQQYRGGQKRSDESNLRYLEGNDSIATTYFIIDNNSSCNSNSSYISNRSGDYHPTDPLVGAVTATRPPRSERNYDHFATSPRDGHTAAKDLSHDEAVATHIALDEAVATIVAFDEDAAATDTKLPPENEILHAIPGTEFTEGMNRCWSKSVIPPTTTTENNNSYHKSSSSGCGKNSSNGVLTACPAPNPTPPQTMKVDTSSSTHDTEYENMTGALFQHAAYTGDLNMMKGLMEKHQQQHDAITKILDSVCDPSGNYAIHIASRRGHLPIVQYLVEVCNVNTTMKTNNGCTALHCASKDGHLDVVKYLIEHCKADPALKSNDGVTPLHCAVSSFMGHFDIVRYFIDTCGVDKEMKNNMGWTVLHYACREGHTSIVQYLLETCDVNVSSRDNDGGTALHSACGLGGYLEIVRLLVKAKVPVEMKNKIGKTALHLACIHGHMDIVRYMIENCDANVETKDQSGYTALHYASQKGNIEIVKLLVEKTKVWINTRSNTGSTAIHLASGKGHLDIVRYFMLQVGIDGLAKDCHGCTPLHVASREGHLNIVRYFVEECRFDPNMTDHDGNIAQDLAAAFGKTHVAEYLSESTGSGGPTRMTMTMLKGGLMLQNYSNHIPFENSAPAVTHPMVMENRPPQPTLQRNTIEFTSTDTDVTFNSSETEVTMILLSSSSLLNIDNFPDYYLMKDLPEYVIVLGVQDRKLSSLGISRVYRTLRSQQDTCEILYYKLLRYFQQPEYHKKLQKNDKKNEIPTHDDQLLFVYVETDDERNNNDDNRHRFIPIHRKKIIPSKEGVTLSSREIRDYHVSVDLKLDRRKLITLDQEVENLTISITLKRQALMMKLDMPYKKYIPIVEAVLEGIATDLRQGQNELDAETVDKHRRCIAMMWETYMPPPTTKMTNVIGPISKRSRKSYMD